MTRIATSARAAAAAAVTAVVIVLGIGFVLTGAPAGAVGSLGTLTFDPATGSDLTRPFVQTHSTGGTGCPVGTTAIRAVVNGPAPQWDGKNFVILSKTANGLSTTADFSVQLGDNFLNTANANSVTIVAGRYDVTLFCQNNLGTTTFGTYEGSIWFTSPTAYQDTDPTPTTTTPPASTPPPATTPPATTAAPSAPALVSAAVTGGTARVGSTMTCSAAFSGATAVGYQWLRAGVAISGAASTSYRPIAGDLGKGVACRATGLNSTGITSTTSTARVVVLGPALQVVTRPAITGTAKVGKVLKSTAGGWNPAGATYTYRWLRNGKAIKHGTGRKHTVVAADKGKKLTVRVTAVRPGYAKGVALTKVKRVL